MTVDFGGEKLCGFDPRYGDHRSTPILIVAQEKISIYALDSIPKYKVYLLHGGRNGNRNDAHRRSRPPGRRQCPDAALLRKAWAAERTGPQGIRLPRVPS